MPRLLIQPHSPVPLYHQLREIIRRKIENGEWEPGEAIPSEAELAKQYQVSRITVRQALSALVHMGMLFTEQGRGTFVASRRVTQHLTRLSGFSEVMTEKGMRPSSRVVASTVEEADPKIAAQLMIAPGRPVFRLERVRLGDDQPIAFETSRVPLALCPGIEDWDFEADSFYRVMENEFGIELHTVSETLRMIEASAELAYHLQVDPGLALFELIGVVLDSNGRPVEAFAAYYRGDRMIFHIEGRRKT